MFGKKKKKLSQETLDIIAYHKESKTVSWLSSKFNIEPSKIRKIIGL